MPVCISVILTLSSTCLVRRLYLICNFKCSTTGVKIFSQFCCKGVLRLTGTGTRLNSAFPICKRIQCFVCALFYFVFIFWRSCVHIQSTVGFFSADLLLVLLRVGLYGLKESIRGLELYSQASATSQNLLFKNVVQINFGLVKFKYPQACQAILIQCNWRKKTTLQHHQLSLVIDIMHHYIAKVVSVSWTCMLCSWHDLSADYSCLGHL